MSDNERQGPGFVIKDRRRFDETGAPRDEAGDAPAGEVAAAPADEAAKGSPELPPLDFSTFILSLSTSALVHLGDAPGPSGATERNLPLAQQTIDIIALLQEKTRGNLTEDETKLVEHVLYDLRLRYVRASGG